MSFPEAALWNRLRVRAPGRPVFRRQHPIGPYVLDFYCAKARLGIEIDGVSHDMDDRPLRDMRRDEWLRSRGVKVFRIPVSEVTVRGIDDIADAIVRMAAEICEAEAPSTALRAVPLPRFAGGDEVDYS
jgi:very-short-patch-repair endonuclease